MDKKQQTAVEWFYQRILAEDIKEVFEQAKAMEKEQIKMAFVDGKLDGKFEYLESEQYYKETYNK
jgi:hypothetical protein